MTLQRRVLGYLVLAAIASCALTVTVGVILVRHRLATQRLRMLEAQADAVAAAGELSGALAPGQHVYGVSNGRARPVGPARSTAVLEAIPHSGSAEGTASARGREFLYVSRATPSGRIVLVRSAKLAFSEWRPFLGSLILAGLGGTLLALALSYVLARRLSRPIGELSSATKRVARGEAQVTVPIDGEDELAQLGQAFNDMSAQLGLARASQRQFLESVSHELKTPLTSIRGYAEALDDGAVPASEAGRVIAAEADRLERLIADLLDLARFERAGFSVAHEPLDLRAIAEQAVARHSPRAHELAITLSCAPAGTAAPAVGDEHRILQVTSNLIENALRLTPPGGSITVTVADGLMAVRDTGPGLREADISRAFERFYLHNRYRSEREVGSGLGLAIVKELVDAMGGTVAASNRPDGGAEFTLRLPVAGRAPPAASGV